MPESRKLKVGDPGPGELGGFRRPSSVLFGEMEWGERFAVEEPPPLVAERVRRLAMADCEWFLRSFWKVRTATGGMEPFELFRCQSEALHYMLQPQAQVLILKARQLGFSTLLAGVCAWLAMRESKRNMTIVSRTEGLGDKLVGQIRTDGYPSMPEWLRALLPYPTNNAVGEIIWSNGSVVESLAAGAAAARGSTASFLVLDEWAHFTSPDEAWSSAKPTTSSGGSLVAMSTAKAPGTLFEKQWRDAVRTVEKRRSHKEPKSPFMPLFYPWNARPERDEDWYERNVVSGDHTPAMRAREWPSTPDEAFTQAGGAVFGRVDRSVHRPEGADRRVLALDTKGQTVAVDERAGSDSEMGVSVWVPPAPEHRYVVGADVGAGVAAGDFSSAHVIDAADGTLVAAYHRRVGVDVFAQMLFALGGWYNDALLCVERNGVGLAVVIELNRDNYRNLFYQYPLGERVEFASEKIGFHTTAQNKGMIVANLEAALRTNEITVCCPDTLAELDNFTYDEKTRKYGRSDVYDDRVISLALANFVLPFALHTAEYRPAPRRSEPEEFTADWLFEKLNRRRRENSNGSVPMGILSQAGPVDRMW